MGMDIKLVEIKKSEELNFILGHSHFIKTVEDLHEAIVNINPAIRFGLAFCEASQEALVRYSGNDAPLMELARENAAFHQVESRIKFIQEDVFSLDFPLRVGTDFDILVSNPPYISEEEFAALPDEVRLFEPHTALRDGSDGLTFHRRITELSEPLLRSGGKIYLEVGMGQAPRVTEILAQAGFESVHSIRDLAGIERVVAGTKKMD